MRQVVRLALFDERQLRSLNAQLLRHDINMKRKHWPFSMVSQHICNLWIFEIY